MKGTQLALSKSKYFVNPFCEKVKKFCGDRFFVGWEAKKLIL
jgi:hypothetical protein